MYTNLKHDVFAEGVLHAAYNVLRLTLCQFYCLITGLEQRTQVCKLRNGRQLLWEKQRRNHNSQVCPHHTKSGEHYHQSRLPSHDSHVTLTCIDILFRGSHTSSLLDRGSGCCLTHGCGKKIRIKRTQFQVPLLTFCDCQWYSLYGNCLDVEGSVLRLVAVLHQRPLQTHHRNR